MRLKLILFAFIGGLGLLTSLQLACAQNGNGTIFPSFPSGAPFNTTAVKYTFKVVQNTSTSNFKILFSDERFWGSDPATYLIEHDLYSDELTYTDPIYTTWPQTGQQTNGIASLRLAVPDYNKLGLTGCKTSDPTNFPRQSYIIDGFTGVPKTDMMSQFSLNGLTCTVTVARGPVITDRVGWKFGSVPLPRNVVFRQWNATVTIGAATYKTQFALPNRNAQYVYPWELLVFFTEFYKLAGQFKVDLYGMAYQTEGSTTWQPLNQWQITAYDGTGSDWGFKKIPHGKGGAVEVSNSNGPYLPLNSIIDLSTP